MPEPDPVHSWVWTVGAAAVVSGAIFGQLAVVQIPAPEVPPAATSVREPRPAGRQAQSGRDERPAGPAGAAAASPGSAGGGTVAVPGTARPAAAYAARAGAGRAAEEAGRRLPLILREATTVPWTVPGPLLAAVGGQVGEVEHDLAREQVVCGLFSAAYGLVFSGRADTGGSAGCSPARRG